jgi:peroxiredoxin
MAFKNVRLVVFAIAIALAHDCSGIDRSSVAPSGRIDDFSLPTVDDDAVSLSRDASIQFHVLCFLGTECPLARVYGPRLQRMSEELSQRGVQFIGINSNVQDSMDELKDYVEQHGIKFPVAKDYDRQVAVRAGATRTPEVFVIDRAGEICYQGRIDDQYQPGIARSEATEHDLRDAIEQLLAGVEVTRARTIAVGCLIALPRKSANLGKKSNVTYCDQIIRVLQKHCIECHRAGEIGPFALEDYDEVVGWADMSMEVIDEGRMPPWHASPEYGTFANSRHMPGEDKETLRQWVEAGTPYGDAKRLPPKLNYVTGWRFSDEPDVIIPMTDEPFQVPAEGTVEYQYFVVDPGFKEDVWIRGAQVIPGSSAVVHHAIVFTRPPDGADFRDIGFLNAYVPGQTQGDLPDGYAQRVAAGSRFVFQMHYTPTGKPEQDITRLGLVFADPEDVTHEVFVLGGIEQEFEIPPGAANHKVDGSIGTFPKDGFLLSITPHMHLRGKSFEFRIKSGGKESTLLKVPNYDFNWQHNYQLTSPLPLQQIETLRFTAAFDNSSDNPTNPDPSEFVTWGDQTWQEMAVTFVAVAQPRVAQRPKPEKSNDENRRRWDREAGEFADRYVARFDANGDQHLTPHELPDSVRMFSFRNFDHDNDARLSRDEIKSEAYWRIQRSQSQKKH